MSEAKASYRAARGVFEQGIDRWLRWVDSEYVQSYIPCPIQGYVDDVCLMSQDFNEINLMINKSDKFLTTVGMEVKHRKCAILYGQRTGNS